MDSYRSSARRRAPDSLEDGLDRLVAAGRQLVDGVSGARPGSRRRTGAIDRGSGGERGAGVGLPRLGELGRWVEQRLDGLLDADHDDWREPWQEPRPSPRSERPRRQQSQRQPLLAISRRSSPLSGGSGNRVDGASLNPDSPSLDASGQTPTRDAAATAPAATEPASPRDWSGEAWPDDETFTLPRWQRDPRRRPADNPASPGNRSSAGPRPADPRGIARPLPRSSRRRAD